jgi:hypothetical protein
MKSLSFFFVKEKKNWDINFDSHVNALLQIRVVKDHSMEKKIIIEIE